MPETYYAKKRRGIAGLTGRASTRVPPKEYWPGLGELELGYSNNHSTSNTSDEKRSSFGSSTKFRSVPPKFIGKKNFIAKRGNRANKNMTRLTNQWSASSSRGNNNIQPDSKLDETPPIPKSPSRGLVNPHMRRRSPKRILKLSTPTQTPVAPHNNNNSNDKDEGTGSDRAGSDHRNEEQPIKREAQQPRKPPEQSQQSSSESNQDQPQSQQSPKTSTSQSPTRKRKHVKRMFTELFPHNTVGLNPSPFEIEETRKPRVTQSQKQQLEESRKEKRRKRMLAELAPYNAVGLVSDQIEPKTTPKKPKSKQQPQRSDHKRTKDKPPKVNRMLASIAPFNGVGRKELETGKRRSRRSESRSEEPLTSRGNRPKRKRALLVSA